MNKLPIGTGLLLPAADMGAGILERMQEFAEQPGMEPIKAALEYRPIANGKWVGINRASIADLIASIYLDMLHNFSKWNKGATEQYTQAQWMRMVEGWESIPTKIENELFNKVIRDAYEEIHDTLNWMDSECDGWSIWYVRRSGYDVVIVRGEDFRIADWERRMQAGADYLKAKELGEEPPSHAWLPDEEATRFISLVEYEQRNAGPLGKTAIDELDKERAESKRQAFGNRRRMFRGEAPNL